MVASGLSIPPDPCRVILGVNVSAQCVTLADLIAALDGKHVPVGQFNIND